MNTIKVKVSQLQETSSNCDKSTQTTSFEFSVTAAGDWELLSTSTAGIPESCLFDCDSEVLDNNSHSTAALTKKKKSFKQTDCRVTPHLMA